MKLTWQDQSTNETGFVIYRGAVGAELASAQVDMKVGEVGEDVEEFVDGEVEPGSTYEYEVVAVGEGGESERARAPVAASVPVGLGAMVGVINSAAGHFTNVFIISSLPEDEIAGGVQMRIEGPPGWNNDEVIEEQMSESAARDWLSRLVLVDPVPGDYTVTLTTTEDVYTAIATLPENPKIYPMPTEVTVTDATASEVSATWTADSVYEAFFVAVFEAGPGDMVSSYERTNDTLHTISGLSLGSGAYTFLASGYPIDVNGQPVMIDDFGAAYRFSEPFVIGAQGESCISAEPIQDPALAEAFAEALGIDGQPDCADVASVDRVDASWRDISNLSGIEFAVNLVDLQVDGNAITDLGFVVDLPDLRYLYFGGNPISDMEPLRGLPIQGISLWGTDVTPEHAASVVESLTDLEILYMGGVGPADMSFLSGHDLLILEYSDNGATALPDLSANTLLHQVSMVNNELSAVADLDALINVFEGRTPAEWWGPGAFEVRIEYNRFDLGDAEVMSRIQALEDMGVDVSYEPQNDPLVP